MSEPTHPMVPYVAGWLLSALHFKGGDAIKIADVCPDPPDAFEVTLVSGLRLRVTVAEVKP